MYKLGRKGKPELLRGQRIMNIYSINDFYHKPYNFY